jgi:expansin (peptidoglycan-binding protein)
MGEVHSGEYELGPVEWTGSYWNSCGPYPDSVTQLEGVYLAGLENTYNGNGSLCDACILMTTGKGKSLVLRVVTTGVAKATTNADISQEAFDLINEKEEPRAMTWQIVACPDTGKIQYQYQTQANTDWTSLWVRNARVPVSKVEVMSKKHATWFALTRGSDGTLTDNGGFGTGSFTLRVTGLDGNVVTDTFPSFTPGALVPSTQQLD